jgi:NAD(P)-dependent dehydrogenase (short-subunit alcohol dehydrogenase family)
MLERRHGRIINVTTNLTGGRASVRGTPYFTPYTTTKTALVWLTECLALETREHGIAVFAVAPGNVATDMFADIARSSWARKLLGPNLTPENWSRPVELPAQICVLLASGRADSLSGRYLHASDDIGALIRQAEVIQQQDLRTLRLRT